MLTALTIHHYAIVEHLALEFDAGFTVITGETGAGKSILMDALGLCLGDRAEGGVVRSGAARADITATFHISHLPDALAWLRDRDLDDEDSCSLRRTLTPEGRSKAFINGRPATLSDLRELGQQLIDIHGQQEHQTLLRKDSHRRLLDAYAQTQTEAQAVAAAYRSWQQAVQAWQTAEQAQADRAERLALLDHQIEQLTALGLAPGDYEQLSQQHDTLAHLDALLSDTEQAALALTTGDGDTAERLVQRALRVLQPHAQRSTALQEAVQLLDSVAIQLSEVEPLLQHATREWDNDPNALMALADRLERCHALARRYRVPPETLPDLLSRALQEQQLLAEQGDLTTLKQTADSAEAHYLQRAEALRQRRQAAAHTLAEALGSSLKRLSLNHARLDFTFTPLAKPQAQGLDDIELMFSANPGQPLRPLIKVASGGELSRLSLAIQVVSAQHDTVPVMVFDEVDVGIGGGVADGVGRLLAELGQRAQVFSITHQPQVAARGQHHLRVEKTVVEGQVNSRVIRLSPDERIDEVARMSGGAAITDETRRHAAALLQQA